MPRPVDSAESWWRRTPCWAASTLGVLAVLLTAPSPARGDEEAAGAERLAAIALAAPIVVDGDLADWPEEGGGFVADLGRPAQLLPARRVRWRGPDDLSGRMRIGVDRDAIYLALHLVDDHAFHPGQPWWAGDAVELFLDLDRRPGAEPGEAFSEHCWQIFLMPRNPEQAWGVAYQGTRPRFDDGGLFGVEVARREREDGYDLEARLPWEGLGGAPRDRREIGFALAVNDADTGPSEPGTYLSWNRRFELYRLPRNFGVLELPPVWPAPPAPHPDQEGASGLPGFLLVLVLAVMGVFLLAGPGARVLSRLGPAPKIVALGLTGLLALVLLVDERATADRAVGEVRGDLERLARDAGLIAEEAAAMGALPLGDETRREQVLAALLRGERVPTVLPPDAVELVPVASVAPIAARGELAWDLPLDRRHEIELGTVAPATTWDVVVRWQPFQAQDEARRNARVPLGRLRILAEGRAGIEVPLEVEAGASGLVRIPVQLPAEAGEGEEAAWRPERVTWEPAPAGRRARLVAIEIPEGEHPRRLLLAERTEDGVPVLAGPGSPRLERTLRPDGSLSLDLPYLLGADRLWLVLSAPGAYPHLLGDAVVAHVRVEYDEGDAAEVALRNGEHLSAEQLPFGIARPATMASRTAYRWTDEDGRVHTHDAVPIRLDPARRARRLVLANLGPAGAVTLRAATLVRSQAPPGEGRLGVAPGASDGADVVFVRLPDAAYQSRLGRGPEGAVRWDGRVGPPERPTDLTLSAPLPPHVAETKERTHVALLTCLAIALLVLAFLAADAMERFHRLTLRLAFGVLVASLVPLAAAILLIDRTTSSRLESEHAARARTALASAEKGVREALARVRETAEDLSLHLSTESRLGAGDAVARLVRLYRSSALPPDSVAHTVLRTPEGTVLDVAGETPATSLASPRFLAERANRDGLHVSPWDRLLLVGSARHGAGVQVVLGVRVDDAFLDTVVSATLPGGDVVVAILDGRGHPLASTGGGARAFATSLGSATEEVRRLLEAHDDAVLPDVSSGARGGRLAVVERLPAVAPGAKEAWLAVGLDRTAIASTLAEQREQLAWLALFGVLLVAGVATLTARRVADPVRGLVRVTEAVRRGEFDVAVPPAGTDEVGDLTVAFDQMRLDLKHRVADLDFLRRAQDELAASLDYGRRAETVVDLLRACLAPDAIVLIEATSAAGPLAVVAEQGRRSAFTDRALVASPGGWLEEALTSEHPREYEATADDARVGAEGAIGARLVEDRPAWLTVPLRAAGEPIAMAVLAWDDEAAVPRGEGRRLLEPLAGTCALALNNARLYRLAALDDVTRLPGSTAFEAALRADIEWALSDGPPVTLLRIGLDHLEHVTLRRGVEIARELLRSLGLALRGVAGDLDRLGRLREDELAVRVVGNRREEALALAERVRERLSGVEVVPEAGGEPASSGVSIGVARAPDDATSLEFLLDAAARALASARREGGMRVEDVARLDAGLVDVPPFEEGAIFRSERMVRVVEAARRAARADSSILITGETGTGKEVIANLVHRRSARAERPFVKVNCAAFPETLLESELFGHERGAFTGAERRREGRFELADGGTLFLDEIAEMSPSAQVKLLRVLQERQFNRLGGTRPVLVDVRIIAATNRNLEAAVSDGSFREDLYYRLNVIRLELPALRERREEIPLFVERFLADAVRRAGRGPQRLTSDAMDLLYRHPWPGNVRELKNAIERAVVLCDATAIGPEHLRLDGAPGATVGAPRAAPLDDLNARQRKLLDHLARHGRCTNREYQELTGTSARTGLRDLQDLMERGLLLREGRRRGAVYRLPT